MGSLEELLQEHHPRFFSVEYALSSASYCKLCSEKIIKGEIRIILHIKTEPDQHYFDQHKIHKECFFNLAEVPHVKKFNKIELLKLEDQKMLNDKINPKPEIERFASSDFQIEYYNISRKSKCHTCKNLIKKGSIAIYMARQKKWYDLECFRELNLECDSQFKLENITGFSLLTTEDQNLVKNVAKAGSKRKATESNDGQKNKKKAKQDVESTTKIAGLKRKSNTDDVDETVENSNGMKRAKTNKDTHIEAWEKQCVKITNLKDKLSTELNLKEIKTLLSKNGQLSNGLTKEMLLQCLCDALLFGPTAKCPICEDGNMVFDVNGYKCSGHYSRFVKCTLKTQNPVRRAKIKIIPELKNKSVTLREFKFKPANRLFKVKVDNQTFNRSVRNTSGFSDEPQLLVQNNPNKDVVNVNYKLGEEKTKLLRDNGCTLYDETLKKPFMAALDSIDVAIGKNSFYKIEIIHSNTIYYLYRTYGRIGTEYVKSNLNEFKEEDSAVKKFCELYLEKTGNEWKDSLNFEKKPGKYFQVDMDNGSMEDGHLEHAIDWARLGQIKLDAKVKEVISSLFNVEKMEADLKEFKIDTVKMPLGKISSKSIKKAFSILNEIEELSTSATRNVNYENLIKDANNRFYSIIPHNTGTVLQPIIDSKEAIEVKSEMLQSLLELDLTYSLIRKLSENNATNSDDMIKFYYDKLKCRMNSLDNESEEYAQILTYVKNSHGPTHSGFKLNVEEIIELDRQGEEEKFNPENLQNRSLLWHGSRRSNFVGILSKGLKIAPKEAPISGYMFGKGIYFADMVSKSANYCMVNKKDPYGYLLLCDVALGEMYKRTTAQYVVQLQNGKHSTKGCGRTIMPEQSLTKHGYNIPIGEATNDPNFNFSGDKLLYNEYVVYDPSQVKMKYLVKVKFDFKSSIRD